VDEKTVQALVDKLATKVRVDFLKDKEARKEKQKSEKMSRKEKERFRR